MTDSKYLLTDADGVILDWQSGIVSYLRKFYSEMTIDIAEPDFGLEREIFYKIINEFNRSPDFGRLGPVNDSKEYLKKFHELGFKIIVISTCMGNDYTKIMRVTNLRKIYGDIFTQVICLPIGSSKLEALTGFPESIWIDDLGRNCVAGVAAGHTTFQMMHDYNTDDKLEGVIKVKNWQELYERVI